MIHNYSTSKLELLVIKWVVTEKFRDYLLGTQLAIYTDNKPLAYIKKSKVGVPQIRWLSKLALLDFGIKYRIGKSNQAAHALSHHSRSNEGSSSDAESKEYEMILYEAVSDDLTSVVKWD